MRQIPTFNENTHNIFLITRLLYMNDKFEMTKRKRVFKPKVLFCEKCYVTLKMLSRDLINISTALSTEIDLFYLYSINCKYQLIFHNVKRPIYFIMISYFLYHKALAALKQEAKRCQSFFFFLFTCEKINYHPFAGYPFLFHSTD